MKRLHDFALSRKGQQVQLKIVLALLLFLVVGSVLDSKDEKSLPPISNYNWRIVTLEHQDHNSTKSILVYADNQDASAPWKLTRIVFRVSDAGNSPFPLKLHDTIKITRNAPRSVGELSVHDLVTVR